MVRVVVAFLCVLPWLPVSAEPDFALATRHGRLHLIASPGETKVHVDLQPYWPWEGTHSHVEVEETEYGAAVHAAVDITGPYWLYIEIEQSASGICLHARHSNAGEFEETWWFDQFSELSSSDAVATPYLRALLTRAGCPLLDLDALRETAPCDAELARQTLALVGQLDADRWSVREAASIELHSKPYRDHVARLTAKLKLKPEQRARLADLIDVPVIELTPALAAGVAALFDDD